MSQQRHAFEVIERMSDAYCILDSDFHIVSVNTATERLLGVSRTELLGRSHWDVFPAAVNAPVGHALLRVVEEGSEQRLTYHYESDGYDLHTEVEAYPTDAGGVAMFWRDVTERTRTEEALRKSEAKYRTLFESIDEGFCVQELVFDERGEVVDIIYREANATFEQHTGFAGANGKRASEIFPHIEQHWFDALTRVHRTGISERTEGYNTDTKRWLTAEYSAVGGAGSSFIVAVFNDITERKHQEQRQQYLLLLNDALRTVASPVGVEAAASRLALDHFAADRCYYCTIEDGNAIARKDAVRGGLSSVAGIYPLHDFAIFRNAIEAGEPYVVPDVYTADKIDEGLRQICLQLGIVSNIIVPVIKQGTAVGLFCLVQSTPREWTATEINLAAETAERTWAAIERARAEEELHASQERFELIANLVPDLLWESAPEGATNWYNQRWLEYTGQSFEQAIGWRWTDAIHPDDRESSVRRYGDVVETGSFLRQEHRIRRHDGEYRWFVVTASPFKDDNGHVIKMYGSATDIHDQRVLLEATRQNEERLAAIFARAAVGLSELTLDGRFLRVNDGLCAILGRSRDELLMMNALEVTHPDDVPASRATLTAAIEADEPTSLDKRYLHSSGRQVWVNSTVSVLRDGQDKPHSFLIVTADITERKEREDQQEFLLKFSDNLRAETNADDVANRAIRMLFEQMSLDRCYIGVYRPEWDRADLTHQVGNDRVPPLPDTIRLSDFPEALRIASDRTLVIDDSAEMEGLSDVDRRNIGALGLRALVAASLRKGENNPIWTIVAVSAFPRHWTQNDLALLEQVTERTWSAVEHARAEEALRNSEEHIRIAADAAELATWDWNLPANEVIWNTRHFLILGMEPQPNPVQPETFLKHVLDEDKEWVSARLMQSVAKRDVFEAEFRIRRDDGVIRWMYGYGRAVETSDGKTTRMSGVMSDVTERKQAEEALRESEARFRTLSDAVPQVIWVNAGDGRAHYFNQRWYDYSGLSYEESVGPGWQVIVHPEDAPASVQRWEQALAEGSVFDTEYRLRRHDGVYRWFLGRNIPLKDDNGRVIGWFGSATDIEEMRQAQQARQESEERFRLLVEGARDYAMFLMDPVARIVFWSIGAERVFGWSEAEALGQSIDLVFSPKERELKEPEREVDTARTTGSAVDRHWHVRKDGSRFWADGMLMRLDDEGGNLRGFAKVIRDATNEKRAEQAIILANEELEERVEERTQALAEQAESLAEQAESLAEQAESLAEMSSMRQELLRKLVTAQEEVGARISRDLHDDTGQQITGLLLSLNALKDHPCIAQDAEGQGIIAQIQELAQDIAQKSHRLSFTLRPTALEDQGLIGALLNYTETWSTWSGLPVSVNSIGIGIGIGREGSEGRLPKEIEATIYRIAQEALTNILKYAAPGRMTSTGSDSSAEDASRVEILVQRSASEVRVTIEDDGPGFDVEEVLSRPPGQRRLGIFGMQERSRLVGGTFDIESAPGEGTTIYIRVPIV